MPTSGAFCIPMLSARILSSDLYVYLSSTFLVDLPPGPLDATSPSYLVSLAVSLLIVQIVKTSGWISNPIYTACEAIFATCGKLFATIFAVSAVTFRAYGLLCTPCALLPPSACS